jgi:NAD+ synthase
MKPQDGDLTLDATWTARILERFIAVEVGRTGKRRVVLGLSGGIDSAVAACLAVRALGGPQVTCLMMPYRTSSPDSLRDARELALSLGAAHETLDITPMIDGFAAIRPGADRLRLGNAMARARMILLYDASATLDALVLGTSNKTELMLGYGTLHGDMASAINPIGDLYKTQVRALAEHLDVPGRIRTKTPSADLWPEQSDEDELGHGYDAIDRVLALLVDSRVTAEEAVARGVSPALVEWIASRIVRSQFKRMPPIIAKVSARSIGWDFRYPRDWRS